MIFRNEDKELEKIVELEEESFWDINPGTLTFLLPALA